MALFYRMIRGRPGLSVLGLCVSAASIALTLWWNTQLSDIINCTAAGSAIPTGRLVMAVGTMLLCGLIAYGLAMASALLCETLTHDLRMGFATYLSALELPELERTNTGDQISKLQNEIGEVSAFLRGNLFSFVDDLVRFVGTFSWMLWMNPKLALISFGPVAVLLWYTAVSSRVIGEAAQESQRQKAQMNIFADTLLSVFPVMRLFEAAAMVRLRYDTALERWQAAVVREEKRRAALMSLSAMMSCIPMLLLFWVGGHQVIASETTIGLLYAFVNLSGNVSGVMMNLPGRIGQFRRFSVNMQRLVPSILLRDERSRP